MNSRVQALMLLMFGAVLVRLAIGDELLRYVRPVARPWIAVAAVATVMLGVGGLLVRDRVDRHAGSAGSRAAWLLTAPLLVLVLVAPPALGAFTASRPPTTPPRPGSGFAALPSTDPVAIALSDVVLRSVWGAADSLRGHRLQVVGFVARPSARGFVLARLVITCCAADARPYDLDVISAGRAPPTGSWVAVTGRYAGPSAQGRLVPVLQAGTVVPAATPANPYG